MRTKKVLKPQVVAGGAAVPLGKNFYYMTGQKHKDGGIDVGKDAKTGLEVEDGEVMHLTNKEVKVYSSVPFLNGVSPAEKILKGETPSKVFKDQESYKNKTGLNDDGTIKRNGGKVMSKSKYVVGGKKKVLTNPTNRTPLELPNDDSSFDAIKLAAENDILAADVKGLNGSIRVPATGVKKLVGDIGNGISNGVDAVGKYYGENPGALNDTIGIGSNIIGGIVSAGANNRMLDKLQYAKEPVARQATKLKTNININPQLDKMRETVAAYEKDVDNNTASSRVGLARKQRGRVAGMLQTNELYGEKENTETQLINQDKLNQQRVADANNTDYNRWSEGKAAFNNAVAEKRSENTVGLVETLNSGVQDLLSRSEKRGASRENMLTMAASHPNVNPRILKELGVKSITDKMVADWDKANAKKGKKSKS